MALPTSIPELGQAEADAPSLVFPLGWLMEKAHPAIAYRAYTEVAGLEAPADLSELPYQSRSAIAIAMTQSVDGRWNNTMLEIPSTPGSVNGVGTIPAFRRLLETGWDRESPPLNLGRRALFRMLAEDNDPKMLFELRKGVKTQEVAIRMRHTLRDAAAAALAHAGYEADPRLRGAARRILERMDGFLDSDLAEKPWIRIGNRHVLHSDAYPPSMYALMMLSYMPIFRSEHYPEVERLYTYLCQPKPSQESVQVVGEEIISQPHAVLGDWMYNKNVVDGDVPFALVWFETMARLGFLKRNENWSKLFARLVDDRDRNGIWHPHKGTDTPSTTSMYAWSAFPIEDDQTDDARWTDVTFRIGLIARLLGWRIELT